MSQLQKGFRFEKVNLNRSDVYVIFFNEFSKIVMSNFKSYFFYLPYLINPNKEFPSGTLRSIKYGKKTVKWMFCFLITRAPARISIPAKTMKYV